MRFSNTFASFQFSTIKNLNKTYRIYFKSYTFCTKYLVQFKISCFTDKIFIKSKMPDVLWRFICFKSICKDSMIANGLLKVVEHFGNVGLKNVRLKRGGAVSTMKIVEITCILQKDSTFKCK